MLCVTVASYQIFEFRIEALQDFAFASVCLDLADITLAQNAVVLLEIHSFLFKPCSISPLQA